MSKYDDYWYSVTSFLFWSETSVVGLGFLHMYPHTRLGFLVGLLERLAGIGLHVLSVGGSAQLLIGSSVLASLGGFWCSSSSVSM